MKNPCLLLLAALSALMLAPSTSTAGGRIENGILFPSEATDQAGAASLVYLPDGYDTSGLRYPVLFFLHGNGDSPWINDHELDPAIDAGRMPPIIYVAVNRTTFGGSLDAAYSQHLAREVVPYMDENFRTIPRREGRAIAGFSLGGWESWDTALRYPDVFRLVGSYAMGRRQRSVVGLLQTHNPQRFPLEFWDYQGSDGRPSIRPLMDLLDEMAIPHTYLHDDGPHDVGPYFFDSQAYFARRMWEEVNATDPYPLQRFTQEFNAVAGAALSLAVEIDLQINGETPALSIDGSALGLHDAALPLTHQGDGHYRADLDFTAPARNGVYYLPLRRQIDGVTQIMHRLRLNVYPRAEQILFADALPAGWDHNSRVSFDPQATAQVFDGTTSLGVKSGPPMQFSWTPTAPTLSLGYRLRFAFHPGTASGSRFNLEYEGAFGNKGNVNLLADDAPAGQGIAMNQAAWQIVEIPLTHLEGNEPIQSIGFSGTLSGTFYLDEVGLVPQDLPLDPLPRTFPPVLHFVGGTEDLPTVVDDIPAEVHVDIRTEARVDDPRPTLRLDGSAVGAAASMPLASDGNGRYTAQLPLDQNLTNGVYRLPVLMDSERHGTELFAALRLLVYPNAGNTLYADAELAPEVEPGQSAVVALDPQATDQVFAGQTSLSVQRKLSSRTLNSYLRWTPEQPAFGYNLHLAFHPGQIEELDEPPAFDLRVTHSQGVVSTIPLIGPDAPLDPQQQTWQTAEVPLGNQPIQSIAFVGNSKGTFYLDDLRLVPQTPTIAATAVLEHRQDSAPDHFTLDQNYPNPFNSGTVIDFALPQDQQIDLAVYNLAGQKAVQLVQGLRPAGRYSIHWDGRDAAGRLLATGLYLYRLQAGSTLETRKLLMLR